MDRWTGWIAALLAAAAGACASDPAPPRGYHLEGRVLAIVEDPPTVTVDHEEIPGLMPAMTMDFELAGPELAEGVLPGAQIEAELEIEPAWRITRLRVVAAGPAPPTPDPRAVVEAPAGEAGLGQPYYQVGVGQRVPDFQLIGQDGQPARLASARGQAVVLTFIYTRCPMPDFCPLVTRRMVELQAALGHELQDRTRIWMVSIDPEHDTPEVLDRYARRNGLDLSRAKLLTGPIRQVALLSSYFGLEFWNQRGGNINHKLRVAVIDAQGRLHAELRGNAWSVARVVELVRQALLEPAR